MHGISIKNLIFKILFIGIIVILFIIINGISYADTTTSAATSFTYIDNGSNITITGYEGSDTDIAIPDKINDKNVVEIGDRAFEGFSGLTSITLPNTVTRIGRYVFNNCSSLTNINIPEPVTIIEYQAFHGCSSLTSITLPAVVEKISSYAFYGCSSLTSITLPEAVKNIGIEAFCGCNSLISVSLPSSLTSIDGSVFRECSSLTSIDIPSGVTSIGRYAFRECSSLTSISIPNGVTSIGWDAFRGCSDLTSISIPSGVKNIERYAFRECRSLKKINFLGDLDSIDRGAFQDCISLESIDIPSGVTSLGNYAFSGCSNLKSIILPDGIIDMGFSIFRECSNLTSITFPAGLTNIRMGMFESCVNLTSIDLPDGLTSLESGAFKDSGLINIDIPEGVRSIERDTFSGCSSLTGINIPSGVTIIEPYAFRECSSLKSVNIPESVTSIGFYAFRECSDLKSINLPSGLINIEKGTFFGCSSLESIILPSGLISIGESVFYGCSSLTGINIPNGVTSIGSYVFRQCSSLKSINLPDGLTSIEKIVFYGCSDLVDITLPDGLKNIEMGAFAKCNSLKNITLPYTLKSIKEWAFYDCSSLESITFRGSTAPSFHESCFHNIKEGAVAYASYFSTGYTDNIYPFGSGNPLELISEKKSITNSHSSSRKVEKTNTEKASDEIANAKPNDNGIIQISVEGNITGKERTTFKLPSNFFAKEPVDLTVKSKNLEVTLKSEMFTGKEKSIELFVEKQKELIKDMPIYNIYLKIDGQKVDWESDKEISIVMDLDLGESVENKEAHKFVVVYYDDNGDMEILKSSYYRDGKVYFRANHLSDYGVIYVESTFKDIKDNWAKTSIEALTSRGIIEGINETEFGPEKDISRADFTVLMERCFNFSSNPESDFTSEKIKVFDDVDSGKYYAKAIAIAKEIGLIKGYENKMFKPLDPITREDMMVIIERALEISKEYPNIVEKEEKYLKFEDSNEISSYALSSVEHLINCGIIKDRLGKICPCENGTRSDVADALYSLMKTNMK